MYSVASRTYSVYIMSNRSKTLHIGVTNNPRRRVFEHKKEWDLNLPRNTSLTGWFGVSGSRTFIARFAVKSS